MPETTPTRWIDRRSFLKGTAALSVGSGLPAWFVEQLWAQADLAKSPAPNDRPNVALIGCGGTYIHTKGDTRTNQHPAQAPKLVNGEGIHGIHQHCCYTFWRAFITQA